MGTDVRITSATCNPHPQDEETSEAFPEGEFTITLEVPQDWLRGQSLKSLNSEQGRISLVKLLLPESVQLIRYVGGRYESL